MLAPNPWHEPERSSRRRESDSGVMLAFGILVLAAFGGALLASIGFALLR